MNICYKEMVESLDKEAKDNFFDWSFDKSRINSVLYFCSATLFETAKY